MEPRLGSGGAASRVNLNVFHQRQIDHQAAVAYRLPADAVGAATHGDHEIVVARKLNGSNDVGCTRAARDERRTLVNLTVPHAPCFVIPRILWRYELAVQGLAEPFDCTMRQRRHIGRGVESVSHGRFSM